MASLRPAGGAAVGGGAQERRLHRDDGAGAARKPAHLLDRVAQQANANHNQLLPRQPRRECATSYLTQSST